MNKLFIGILFFILAIADLWIGSYLIHIFDFSFWQFFPIFFTVSIFFVIFCAVTIFAFVDYFIKG
jgi:hypothetical protein